MDHPVGTIQAIHRSQGGPRATVEVAAGFACPRCAEGKGCGAGLLTGERPQRVVEATISEASTLVVGDTVQLQLGANRLLAAAMLAYGTPLLGALTGAALAFALQFGDVLAVAAVLTGVVLGLAVGRWRLRRDSCLQDLLPHVQNRL